MELSEQAKKCVELSVTDAKRCRDCPFNIEEYKLFGECRDKLLLALAEEFEMAYEDLRFSPSCVTCKYFEVDDMCDQCIINNQYRVPTNWKWRGDKE